MAKADDEVRAIRFPRALWKELHEWHKTAPSEDGVTLSTSIRRLIERGLRETKRKLKET
jgi:hypothetical protein